MGEGSVELAPRKGVKVKLGWNMNSRKNLEAWFVRALLEA
jgi:hypothetical protein